MNNEIDKPGYPTGPEIQSGVRPGVRLPGFLVLVIFLTFLSWVSSDEIAGYRITGWSWVIMLVASCLLIFHRGFGRIMFPLRFWLPWIGLMVTWWAFRGNHPHSLQTLIQVVTPVVVGCAASSIAYVPSDVKAMYSWLTGMFYVVLLILFVKLPMLLFLELPRWGMMTAEASTCCLLAAVYVAFYATGSRLHLSYYLVMLLFPAIMLTRGPLLAAASAFLFSLSPVRIWQRLLLGLVLLAFGLMLFHSSRYQKLMFYSGEGRIEEVRWDNVDLKTSGRKPMWEVLWDSWKDSPVTGHGLNSSRTVLFERFDNVVYLPHNDWLKLMHDTGIAGAGLYALAILLQVIALLRIAGATTGKLQALAYAAASIFVPYIIIMFVDNVMLYVQYYSNLHFALIGVVYGAFRQHPMIAFGRRKNIHV